MEKNRIIQKVIEGKDFYYNSAMDKIFLDQEQYENNIFKKKIKSEVELCLEITKKCNFMCRNCFASTGRGMSTDFMPIAEINKTIEFLYSKVIRIDITGGEPFFHPNICEILEFPRRFPNCGFVIGTNGTMLKKYIRKIIDYQWCLTFSLHGREKTHNKYTNSDGFDIAIKNLHSLAPKTNVHIYSVINNFMDIKDVDWLINTAHECNVKQIRFLFPREAGRFESLVNNNVFKYVQSLDSSFVKIMKGSSHIPFIGVDGNKRSSS